MDGLAGQTVVAENTFDREIENAIDDLVWNRDCEDSDHVFRDRFIARFKDISWHSEICSAYSTGVSYTGRICQHTLSKAREHGSIAKRLQNIQACIVDTGMRLSLEPLVVHHQRISNSYMEINAFFA
jgi:hypothetical protein